LEGYISKDIYIPYPIQKSRKRIFPYPFFEWDMLKDIISLFWGTFALQNTFFLLNTEINCEYPLLNYVYKLTIFKKVPLLRKIL
jgi:hypothetical protein